MNRRTRVRLDTVNRVYVFSQAHQATIAGYVEAVKQMGDLLARANTLAVQVESGERVAEASAARKEDTRRIIHGVWRLDVEARASFPNPPLTLVPTYPDLPMEKVYPRAGRTEQPEVYLRSTPRGRVAYFPWDVDRTFWEVMAADHGKLLRNAVAWATNEEMAVSVTGSGVLDVTAWRQETSITVHLVNLTNAMMMKGPVRELMAVGEQKVRIRMPNGAKPKKTRLLAAEKAPRTRYDGKHLHVIVPSVLDHEVVAIDL